MYHCVNVTIKWYLVDISSKTNSNKRPLSTNHNGGHFIQCLLTHRKNVMLSNIVLKTSFYKYPLDNYKMPNLLDIWSISSGLQRPSFSLLDIFENKDRICVFPLITVLTWSTVCYENHSLLMDKCVTWTAEWCITRTPRHFWPFPEALTDE